MAVDRAIGDRRVFFLGNPACFILTCDGISSDHNRSAQMSTERAGKELPSSPPNTITLDTGERGGEWRKKKINAGVTCSC